MIKPKRNNAQHQPLTTVLRNIIREYPAGGGVLRELCQNADDSKATTIEFVLDEGPHPTDPLLHKGLAEFQGPSLLAYNNRTFSETDFRSLSRIGDSEKAKDPSSTGKFGRGFNSVYNWTDGPTILSGRSLLILDPHENWSRDVGEPGGPLYDFVESADNQTMINHLSPFRTIISDFTVPFEGTVIRLPLRTSEQAADSKILPDSNRKPTLPEDIKEVFCAFVEEMVESLIFLKHITSITLRIGDTVFAKAVARKYIGQKDITETFSIDEPYQSVLVRGEEKRRDKTFLMEIKFQGKGRERVSRYAITHHMRRHLDGDLELENWARSYKLFPWVAIASPISKDYNHKCKLFNTLPLPISAHNPAHIHGMFSVTPDRASIHRDEDLTISEDTETKRGARWNRWLFEQCIVHAWVVNLQFIDELTRNQLCDFSGWNLWPAGLQAHGEQKGLGAGVLGSVFEQIVGDQRQLLPTIGGTTAKKNEVIFAKSLDESLALALQNAGVVVICPPSDRTYELSQLRLESLGIASLSAGTVRAALAKLEFHLHLDANYLDTSSRSILLDYILSDKNYSDVAACRAPFIPMLDGSYNDFKYADIHYRFNRGIESEIFIKSKAYSIDNSKLSPKALEHFEKNMLSLMSSTNVADWSLDAGFWYCRKYIFAAEIGIATDTIGRSGFVNWVDKFWTWARTKSEAEAVKGGIGLWLIPVMGERYHKIGASGSQVLDVSGSGIIAEILQTIIGSSALLKDYPIYLGVGVSSATTAFFRQGNLIVDCENLEVIVKWFYKTNFLNDNIKDKQVLQIIAQLAYLSRRMLPGEGSRLKPLVRRLPLFRRAFGVGPQYTWVNLEENCRYVALPATNKFPTLSCHKIVFLESGDPGITQILPAFSLGEVPSIKHVLEKFIIPSISDSNGQTRTSLSKFVLQSRNIDLLGLESRKLLAHTNFIPVKDRESTFFKSPSELVDPASDAALLYFSHEDVFPEQSYLKEFSSSLKRLQMITLVTAMVVIDRLKEYSKYPESIPEILTKLKHLFTVASQPPELSAEILELRWIPASDISGDIKLCNAHECRDRSQEKLVKYSLSVTPLEVGSRWRLALGWQQNAPDFQVLKQLDGAVEHHNNDVLAALLECGWLNAVADKLKNKAWIPGASGGYHRSTEVFFKDARGLSPYLDEIMPSFKNYFSKAEGTNLGCFTLDNSPSFQKLEEVQCEISAQGIIGGDDLKVFVLLLNAVATRFPKENLKMWKAPDISGKLHDLGNMTLGTLKEEDSNDPLIKDLVFLHPDVTWNTIRVVKFPTIQERFLDEMVGPEFIQDFEQDEELTTVISDTLRRIEMKETFSEYLGNAEDAGSATKICWVVDDTKAYPKKKLISKRLEDCQNQALLCYNDGVFTEKDFSAVIKIGVGSKRQDSSKIGRFGRGSLTMYHWTLVPSFISGDYFVIFDPEQTRLPPNPATRKPRKGMKILIRDVRRNWPDQLRPFEGLFGFNSQSDSFKGTLFRFPVMASRSKSKIHCSGLQKTSNTQHMLESYYNDARISLIFLKNVRSITYFERNFDSSELLQRWTVTIPEAPIIPGVQGPIIKSEGQNLGIEFRKCTIISKEEKSAASEPRTTTDEWHVVSRRMEDNQVPSNLRHTQRLYRLQARCAIAACCSTFDRRPVGRLFLDLPINHQLKLPVNISADLVIQSDRKTLSSLQGQDGSEWNKWIYQKGIVPLYSFVLSFLAEELGNDAYNYWPENPGVKETINDISDFISIEFWKALSKSRYKLFPTVSNGKKVAIETSRAWFNLREGLFLGQLLREFDDEDSMLIVPRDVALSGLLSIDNTTIKVVSPINVLTKLKLERCHKILCKYWKKNKLGIGFANSLLKFIITGVSRSDLVGCSILPLADSTFGCLNRSGSLNFIAAQTDGQMYAKLLGLIPSQCVHPKLDTIVLKLLLDKLRGEQDLNISYFSIQDFPRLFQSFHLMSTGEKREWLKNIWQCFNQMAATEEVRVESLLVDLPIIAATKNGRESDYFYSLEEFTSCKYPVILDRLSNTLAMSWEVEDVRTVLQYFTGISVVDSQTLPKKYIETWSLDQPQGLYSLLRAIHSLSGHSIEEFVRSAFSRKPDDLEKLRKVVEAADWDELNKKHKGFSKLVLIQLPIIPSSRSLAGTRTWLSARSALLAPTFTLDLRYVSEAERFVDSGWARTHESQLKFLELSKMPIDTFIYDHIGVRAGSIIPENDLDRYVETLELLNKDFPNKIGKYPIAINGNRIFCMANELYSAESEIFLAAFNHQSQSKFIHPKLRCLGWMDTITVVNTVKTYHECATGIVEQSIASTGNINILLERAGRVFEFLKYNNPYLFNHVFCNIMKGINFVPALSSFTNNGTFRQAKMRSMLPPTHLISLSTGAQVQHAEVCWSQRPIFRENPCDNILMLTGSQSPSSETVVKHLIFLSQSRHEISEEEIPYFVNSAKECYRYLGESKTKIFVPADECIWLNTDEMFPGKEEFNSCWVSAGNLFLGLEYDSLPARYIRSSLTPFITLLERCGVEKLEGLRNPPPIQENTLYPSVVLSRLQDYRRAGRYSDITVTVGTQDIGKCHKAVLCAGSEYFQGMFNNRMMETVSGSIELHDITARTAERIIDYIYTGEMTPVQQLGNPADEIDQLLELLEASNRFLLPNLKDVVGYTLSQKRYVRPETVKKILQYAEMVDAAMLGSYCREFIEKFQTLVDREDST